jgi:DNA invertase Pin-like site-specific DNA recombinase
VLTEILEDSIDLYARDALQKDGCEKIYTEVMSGTKLERPQLQEMVANLRKGDVVVVWKLDRLGRSLKHLVHLVNQFVLQDVGLKSLHDHNIDTTTSQGRLSFNIFASLSQFERDLIQERTKAGLDTARARGRIGGKPKGLSPQAELSACAAETLYKERKLTVREIINQLGIAKATFYNYLRHRNVTISNYTKKSVVINDKTFSSP